MSSSDSGTVQLEYQLEENAIKNEKIRAQGSSDTGKVLLRTSKKRRTKKHLEFPLDSIQLPVTYVNGISSPVPMYRSLEQLEIISPQSFLSEFESCKIISAEEAKTGFLKQGPFVRPQSNEYDEIYGYKKCSRLHKPNEDCSGDPARRFSIRFSPVPQQFAETGDRYENIRWPHRQKEEVSDEMTKRLSIQVPPVSRWSADSEDIYGYVKCSYLRTSTEQGSVYTTCTNVVSAEKAETRFSIQGPPVCKQSIEDEDIHVYLRWSRLNKPTEVSDEATTRLSMHAPPVRQWSAENEDRYGYVRWSRLQKYTEECSEEVLKRSSKQLPLRHQQSTEQEDRYGYIKCSILRNPREDPSVAEEAKTRLSMHVPPVCQWSPNIEDKYGYVRWSCIQNPTGKCSDEATSRLSTQFPPLRQLSTGSADSYGYIRWSRLHEPTEEDCSEEAETRFAPSRCQESTGNDDMHGYLRFSDI